VARVDVFSGVCGFSTVIKASTDGNGRVAVMIESE
jgi:hypothetical protein